MARTVAQMPTGRRRVLLLVVVAAISILVLFTALSGFWIDLLWFREVGFSGVFWTTLRTKSLLSLIFGLLFFVLLYANLLIVRRLRPTFRPLSAEAEIIERYRTSFEPSLRWLLPLVSGVLALFVGLGAATQWQTYLLWRNSGGVSFGVPGGDPLFHRDPAFYVFRLPWLHFVQGWLFSSLVGVALIVGLAHYLWGGIRPQASAIADKVTPQVKAHLSVLLGVIVLIKAWGYYLGQFDLLVSSRGVVTGASYTDVHAQLPALRLLAIIAVVCAGLFLVNIRFRGWALPVIGVGLLALVSVIVGAAFPGAVQRFQVAPQELQKERPYIEDNIRFTQQAFGLVPDSDIRATPRDVAPQVEPADVQANPATISNIRLWRPDILKENYQSLQRIRQYYDFSDVDVDRYPIAGERRVTMLSAREIDQNGIPTGGGTWQNKHLVYTHGYGAVASLVNRASAEGAPLFTLRDIPVPPGSEPPLTTQPRIYFGEAPPKVPFVVVDTGARELDYQGESGQQTTTYSGTGGIPVGNLLQRAVFAYRYRDVNLLISGLIHSDSRIMIYRSLAERVPKPAPFLRFDADPYAAVVDGRLVWIWDAYTTSNAYPYSERADMFGATQNPSFQGLTENYIRNSVKVVVDAYNGSMTYYVNEPSDPIVQVWSRAFPGLFTPLDQAPASLREHFRYPENLFQIQAQQYANYHVENPDVFYQKQDFWQVASDPTVVAGSEVAPPPLRPYYVLMRLPGADQEEFVLFVPFTPQGRQNMVAWMAATSDPTDYGRLVAYEFPSGRNVDGPVQVFSRINQDPGFSQTRTLLGQGGSSVLFGDFLVIPIRSTDAADGMLYVEPVYVRAKQQNAIPELKRVVVVNGDRVGVGIGLEEALTDSFVGQTPTRTGGGGAKPVGTAEQQIADLIGQALDHFDAANAALRSGDLATYQMELQKAQALLEQANQLAQRVRAGGGGGGGGSSSPVTPTAAPTATPSPSATASPSASAGA